MDVVWCVKYESNVTMVILLYLVGRIFLFIQHPSSQNQTRWMTLQRLFGEYIYSSSVCYFGFIKDLPYPTLSDKWSILWPHISTY